MQNFVVGIDLGTTNSVLAYAPLDAERPRVEVLAMHREDRPEKGIRRCWGWWRSKRSI